MNKLGIRIRERLGRSGFFFGAVLFHLVLFLMLLGYVVWQPTPPDVDKPFGQVNPSVVNVLPPVTPPPTNPNDVLKGGESSATSVISVDGGIGAPRIKINDDGWGKSKDLSGPHPGNEIRIGPPSQDELNPNGPRIDLKKVKVAQEPWHVQGQTDKFVIPIYLAKYQDGDWDSGNYLHDGKLASGCLPNLMAKIQEWSNGDIKTRDLKVVALDSPEIVSDPPPFLFFTGHKDFHLTDAEVTNLQAYIQEGGCIWGDSAFAGDGSRFDVAFHREMKRVLPDADLAFEPLADDDVIFHDSRFPIDQMPKGMNQRADPIQCIHLGGKIAILYTPNDYSDMMTMLLQPGRNESEAQMDGWNHWEPQHPLFTPSNFTWHAATFYRNYQPSSSMAAYKLSMNILFRLLHQYDNDLLLTP